MMTEKVVVEMAFILGWMVDLSKSFKQELEGRNESQDVDGVSEVQRIPSVES